MHFKNHTMKSTSIEVFLFPFILGMTLGFDKTPDTRRQHFEEQKEKNLNGNNTYLQTFSFIHLFILFYFNKSTREFLEVLSMVNGPFPSCFEPHYESEVKCKVFIMKISFHSHSNKTNFRVKSAALSLAFIMRLQQLDWKWPIGCLLSLRHKTKR